MSPGIPALIKSFTIYLSTCQSKSFVSSKQGYIDKQFFPVLIFFILKSRSLQMLAGFKSDHVNQITIVA